MTGLVIIDRVAEIRRHANTGGPMSRTRTEVMASTLLGRDEYPIRCPRIVRLGIAFPDADPVELLTQMIAEGLRQPGGPARRLEIPRRLVARPHTLNNGVVDISATPGATSLARADAGLCTSQIYDPARPVLWTQAALKRRLELFDPQGFYA
ncbi:MAG: hypothetical protein IPJ62_09415 [Betaproteobacteria bacterium]|nr:hypothetical protein [Betaproteobacteria bacterium]